MYLFNHHTHNRLSFNTHIPLSKLTEAAADMSLGGPCVTDHFNSPDENGIPAESYDWAPAVAQHQQALPAAGECLTFKLGLELDMPHLNPAAATTICTHPKADFILGPVHNLSPEKGDTDLFFLNFSTVQACYDALDDYLASLALLTVTDSYDVLTHLIYPLHYMQAPVTLNRYQDAIRAILRMVVEKSRGMGVNTCRGRTLEGWRPVLTLYRDCGDGIVTVGSDAHTPANTGKGVQAAYTLLRECGFRRVCTYEKYQPVFHILG